VGAKTAERMRSSWRDKIGVPVGAGRDAAGLFRCLALYPWRLGEVYGALQALATRPNEFRGPSCLRSTRASPPLTSSKKRWLP